MFKVVEKVVFTLFLLLFSCSECQEQEKKRALDWLHRNYGYHNNMRDEDLFTYAMQQETGIKNRKDVLENSAAYPTFYEGSSDISGNCIKLLQCSLMFKGYYLGPISGKFDRRTAAAVMMFKKDALGDYVAVNSTVTPIYFVAIVGKGSYKKTEKGDVNIRKIQQYLNRNYARKCSIIPTDGESGMRTHLTLVQALQIETDCEKIDGRFGPELTEACPTLYPGMKGRKIYILQCALYENNMKVNIDGNYGKTTVAAIKRFQAFTKLPKTGIADMPTIKGLLISTGDTKRPATACDCYSKLSADAAKALYKAGYRFVGRYLTGNIRGYRGRLIPKYIDKEEFQNISAAGLRLFPIFQEKGGHDVSSFCAAQGAEDAKIAITAARKLGIPKNTTIYFSVDCDPTLTQIDQKILPYFRAVFKIVKNNGYNIGVYGTRLVCAKISGAGYAKYSFVNDYSPMYKGNVGYALPKNWAFDQFYELKGDEIFTFSGGKFNLDKVIASGRDQGTAYVATKTPKNTGKNKKIAKNSKKKR